jgi:hypothetical protein
MKTKHKNNKNLTSKMSSFMWTCFGILQCYYNLQNKNDKTHVQTNFVQIVFFLFEQTPKGVPLAPYIVFGPISFV